MWQSRARMRVYARARDAIVVAVLLRCCDSEIGGAGSARALERRAPESGSMLRETGLCLPSRGALVPARRGSSPLVR